MERVGDEQVQGGEGDTRAAGVLGCHLLCSHCFRDLEARSHPQKQDSDGPLPAQSHTGGSVSALPPVPRLSVNALVLHELSRFDKEP